MSFPDDGLRHELIDGEHYVTPSPATIHQRLVGRLHVALHAYLSDGSRGEVVLAPFDVLLSKHDVVEPDLLVVLAAQSGIVTDKHVRGAPAIVIEVLSPETRRRDETLKRQLYARVAVQEYWIVDPDERAVVVCREQSEAAGQDATLSARAGHVLTSALLPGFALPLLRLFPPDTA